MVLWRISRCVDQSLLLYFNSVFQFVIRFFMLQDSPAAHHLHALEELIILNGVEEGEGGLLPHKDQWRCECVYGVGVKAWSWLLAAITWPVHEVHDNM